jgi:DNA-binding MarR family transcriptional regulator
VEALILEPLLSAGCSRHVQSFQAMKQPYTDKQGQYLAFIYYYGKIHGRPPAEAEMQQYFRVSPPSVHQMILTLEGNGLIERTPGQARSIRLLIPREDLPDLV